MMKSRKLGIGLLLMLAVVVTTGSFAYWTAGFTGDDAATSPTVTIGTGETSTSTVALSAVTTNGSALIPSGQGTDGVDDTVTFTVPVAWDEDTTSNYSGVTGDLVVTVVYSMTGFTDTQLQVLFSHSVDVATITEGAAAADVIVTVVFDVEPADITEYNAITTETLTAALTFTVTPQ